MSYRYLPFLVLFVAASAAHAQVNTAYDGGYKPMLDYAGKLKDLVDSAEKREDYNGVKDVASGYKDKLDKMIDALQNAGKNFKDSSNTTWIKATCSDSLAMAKAAKAKAEKLYDRGDHSENCKAEAIDLQASLTDLSDSFKKCCKAHDDYSKTLMDQYNSARDKWWNATKDDRKPVDDLGKTAADARDKFNDLQSKANEAGKIYLAAQDQADKARSDLYSGDTTKTPDEIKSKLDAWEKAEDLVKRVAEAATNADKAAADAQKSFTDAQTAWEKAAADYTKQAADGDDMYKIVQGYHQKAYELSQEYKSFSF